jgi:hypothetical protein
MSLSSTNPAPANPLVSDALAITNVPPPPPISSDACYVTHDRGMLLVVAVSSSTGRWLRQQGGIPTAATALGACVSL